MISHNNGFTLLETLLAITIFAMVMGLAYSSYNVSFHIIDSVGAKAETYSKARITMERIISDLESFYPGQRMVFEGTSETLGVHQIDTLQFSSTAHIRLHSDSISTGPLLVRYQVLEDPDSDSLLLYRSELALTEDVENVQYDVTAPGLLLCNNLTEVAFDYQGQEGEEQNIWPNADDAENVVSLPESITIRLRFNDAQEETPGTFFQTAVRLPAATN